MNDKNQAIDGAVKKAGKHKVSAKRRTLVKGAMGAVPAVLTLRSGAAFAMTSSEMCVDFSQVQAADSQPTVLTTDPDVWVRELVECRVLDNGAVVYQINAIDWVDGNIASGGGGAATVYEDDSPTTMKLKGATPPPDFTYVTDLTCYVLAHIDSTGSKTGTVGDAIIVDNKLPYITDSCWASAGP